MSIESQKQFKEGPEIEHVYRFFEIDAKTELALKERIKKSKGLIRLFVHPDFEEYTTFTGIKDDPEAVEKLREAEGVFQKIITSSSKDTPPIFIFEAASNIEEFQRKEGRLSRLTKQDIFVIRTEGANPNPLSPDSEENYKWEFFGKKISDEERESMWQWIIEEFKKWEIKDILIGGLELHISPKHETHTGCLGRTIEKLKDAFNIEMSITTWPSGRKNLKK